jgi:hypothetical protein
MEFQQALYRDQRRLALAKAQALPSGDPLRDRYLHWVDELDVRIDQWSTASNQSGIVPAMRPTAARSPKRRRAVSSTDIAGISAPQEAVMRALPLGSADASSSLAIPVRKTANRAGHSDEMREGTVGADRLEQLRKENLTLRKMLDRFSA